MTRKKSIPVQHSTIADIDQIREAFEATRSAKISVSVVISNVCILPGSASVMGLKGTSLHPDICSTEIS